MYVKGLNKDNYCQFLLIILLSLIKLMKKNNYNEGQNKMPHKSDILFPNGARTMQTAGNRRLSEQLHAFF